MKVHQFYKGTSRKLFRIFNRSLSINSDEYTRIPEYPPIISLNPKEVQKREIMTKHEKYKRLNTVEEKLFALNMDKYYGWNCMILKELNYPFQFLPFVKFLTRTYHIENNQEQFHKVQNVDIKECKVKAENIRKYLQDAIMFNIKGKKNIEEDASVDIKCLIETINSVLLSYLSLDYPHLLESEVDYEPRLEAFWNVGSFHPSNAVYQERKDKKVSDEKLSELVDHWVQYYGSPVIQIRNQQPLRQLETQNLDGYNDSKNPPEIPLQNSDPKLAYGLTFERRHGTNIPGFWAGNEHEFGLLSYHTQEYLLGRPPHFGPKEHGDTLVAQAILASYAWLLGQASYQGFSTFADVTYPLVTQNIITDGKQFNFSLYQLNTTLLHSENSLNNPRVNVCVTLPSSLLYQEIRGNEFIGWNDNVVSTLLSFYLNKPQIREGVNLKPYLHPEERLLADIEDTERRNWLHRQFRHMYSQRPRHLLGYEIYDWERIYKVKFQTKPFDARSRPFEHDENPVEERKYSEHRSPYIPKRFRPNKKHWTGWRAKFAKTYYPDV